MKRALILTQSSSRRCASYFTNLLCSQLLNNVDAAEYKEVSKSGALFFDDSVSIKNGLNAEKL